MSILTWNDIDSTNLVWWRANTDIVRYCITRFDSHDIKNTVDVYVGEKRVLHIDTNEVQNVQRAKEYCLADYEHRISRDMNLQPSP